MKANQEALVIGLDLGTDSARGVLVNCDDGETLASAEAHYPRWSEGKYQDPERSLYRQHPLDYLEALESCVSSVLSQAGQAVRGQIVGLGVATTGSTPCPVNYEGMPLALQPEFNENPDAMFHLWKDHTAKREAERINEILANCASQDFTRYQGKYISEWYWAKLLHAYQQAPEVAENAATWIECCDWIPSMLSGRVGSSQLYRSACAAGHKALWHSAWGGLPEKSCLSKIHPYLGRIYDSYKNEPKAADQPAGVISNKWAEKLGLPETAVIGGSSLDAHAGAVGAGIQLGVLVVSLGTSTVNILVEDPENLKGKRITHICGQAENSVLPGMMGLESSQAAFGDVYRWFQDLLMWPLESLLKYSQTLSSDPSEKVINEIRSNLLGKLTSEAQALPLEGVVTALDWFNGRRYPFANENLHSAMMGLGLSTSAPEIFQGLVLGTVFGQRQIVEELVNVGVRVREIRAVGGISRKSPYVIQSLADCLGQPINVCHTAHASASGAAIYAAVGCEAYPSISAAQEVMSGKVERIYEPDLAKSEAYNQAYQRYLSLGEFVQGGDSY